MHDVKQVHHTFVSRSGVAATGKWRVRIVLPQQLRPFGVKISPIMAHKLKTQIKPRANPRGGHAIRAVKNNLLGNRCGTRFLQLLQRLPVARGSPPF